MRLDDAAEVGGKAASLGELLAVGTRVPDGIVLVLGEGEMSEEERRSLLHMGAVGLGGGPFAVRSSAVAEDGAERSYAGMFDSVLDVGIDGLDEAVARCVASAGAARLDAYGSDDHGGFAVIVQHMVPACAAGVALTADPVTGDRDACTVTAVRGTGDRLVSGGAAGDEWIARDGRISPQRRPEGAVDADDVLRVAAEARRIAADRGMPQDVEWAIDGDGARWRRVQDRGEPRPVLPTAPRRGSPAPRDRVRGSDRPGRARGGVARLVGRAPIFRGAGHHVLRASRAGGRGAGGGGARGARAAREIAAQAPPVPPAPQ